MAGITKTFGFELTMSTLAPAEVVAPVSVTVQVTVVAEPPTNSTGVMDTDWRVDGRIVNLACTVLPPNAALIVAAALTLTGFVVTTKV